MPNSKVKRVRHFFNKNIIFFNPRAENVTNSVVDPESGSAWICIDFGRLDSDPGQNDPKNRKNVNKFHVLKFCMLSFED